MGRRELAHLGAEWPESPARHPRPWRAPEYEVPPQELKMRRCGGYVLVLALAAGSDVSDETGTWEPLDNRDLRVTKRQSPTSSSTRSRQPLVGSSPAPPRRRRPGPARTLHRRSRRQASLSMRRRQVTSVPGPRWWTGRSSRLLAADGWVAAAPSRASVRAGPSSSRTWWPTSAPGRLGAARHWHGGLAARRPGRLLRRPLGAALPRHSARV